MHFYNGFTMKFLKAFFLICTLTTLIVSLSLFYKKKPHIEQEKVALIGVGFPKCGTTCLFHVLEKNPAIHFMQRPYDTKGLVKASELNFFGNLSKQRYVKVGLKSENKKIKYRPSLNFYQSLLVENKTNIEKSPQYIWKAEALEEIYNYNPKIKILVQIRNPIDWLYSYYVHAKSNYEEFQVSADLSFEDFLKTPFPNDKSVTSLEAGKFDHYLAEVFKIFPPENVVVISHEKLSEFTTMSQLCDHLSLPYPEEIRNFPLSFQKPPSYKNKISPELYTFLEEYYRPYNENLNSICKQYQDYVTQY